ncbi:hypothetical protein [Streptomyces gilvosporeus]|uniref:DUF4352 domain-containing protein n=1 Tax=Streptomyces gilvosporeus TaxID=553510 RepID=A0A1V0TWC9_9ACTN|nr:hypothetical protein [Streptomyces gilvosporeus]ARF57177.1 hypothetical protein B1H19_26110 [Streptomyces gilvosporeus]
MSMQRTARRRTAAAALVLAAGLAFGAVGCGTDSGPATGTAKKPQPPAGSHSSPATAPAADSSKVIAVLRGKKGMVLTLNSAVRDSGGFVTVQGVLKNTSSEPFSESSAWRGDETEMQQHGNHLGGATLIDVKERKRYYVLRDTEGRPLATTGIRIIKPGETLPVFMQFPSPPTSTADVEFQLPTFPTADIEITG